MSGERASVLAPTFPVRVGGERPSVAAATRRLRLHRREWRHDGRSYQLLTLRPGNPTRYAVAVGRHPTAGQTVLVRSDLAGVRLLGRLLWGLAFQQRPDTLLVLEPARMVPEPEDGGHSPSVVFGVAGRAVLTPATARRMIRPDVWRARPSGTVTWNTAGFPGALADLHAWQDERRAGRWVPHPYVAPTRPADVHVSPNVVTVLAVPAALRTWARFVGDAGDVWFADESCTEPDWLTGFDVHAVRHFRRRVSAARRARAEILADPDHPTDPALLDERVRTEVDAVAARRPGPWDPGARPAA